MSNIVVDAGTLALLLRLDALDAYGPPPHCDTCDGCDDGQCTACVPAAPPLDPCGPLAGQACWIPCTCRGGCELCHSTGFLDARCVPDAKNVTHDLLWQGTGLD